MQNTYNRDILISTCHDDTEINVILHALHTALFKYGWNYNNPQPQAQRDAINTNNRILNEFKALILKTEGIEILDFNHIREKVATQQSPVTKQKTLQLVKKLMKSEALKHGILSRRYENDLASFMTKAFKEWCDNHTENRLDLGSEHFKYIIDDPEQESIFE